jgi:hypothetical protein
MNDIIAELIKILIKSQACFELDKNQISSEKC